MVLSITVCTYNRVKYLKLCLNSILNQTKEYRNIEINIIDNNSTDNTAEYIKNLQKQNLNINYFLENKQGISYARNLAIKVCNGEYLAFVDDDATINKDWLKALLNEINKNLEDTIYGGPIYPRFEIKPPNWIDLKYFKRKFKRYDGYLNKIKAKEGFSGGNMCIPIKLFKNSENFNISLGMSGSNLGLGEEPDFFYKLIKRNKNINLYNIADMSITHFEAEYKLKKEYLKERIKLNAKQFTLRTFMHENIFMIIFIIKIKLLIQSLKLLINLFISLISSKHKFKYLKPYWIISGIIEGLFTQK